MEVNDRIRKKRKEIGLTLKQVADKMGVSESLISRYESKEVKNMGIDKLIPLAEVLQTTPSYLMGWEDEEPQAPQKIEDPLMVVAAHHSDYNFSEKQLKEIDRFINFVKQQEEQEDK